MKKKSMVTTGIVLLGIANLTWSYIDNLKAAQDFRLQNDTRTAIMVAEQYEKIKDFGPQDNIQEKLQKMQDEGKISFFILKSDRSPASSSLPDSVSPDFEAISDGKVRMILDAKGGEYQAAYVGQKIGNQEMVVGKLLPKDHIESVLRYNRGNFVRNFLVELSILILVMLYNFRELISIVRKLQWGGFATSVSEGALSTGNAQYGFQESQAIASAFGRVSEQQQKNQSELERLRSQILPSLQHELTKNEQLPYEFDSVMLRVDINQSSAVYSNPEFREIQQYWFDYFKVNCAEIATRYHGFVHEELGDEVIIYFKIQENIESASQAAFGAIACVRDIFTLSQEIDHEIQKRFQFSFRVKSALDCGRLRVFKSSFSTLDARGQERRLKIEGAGGDSRNPFLTTVRMLDFIEDKTVNSCVASGSVLSLAKDLVQSTLPLYANIEDIDDRQSYFWITAFVHRNEHRDRSLDAFFLSNEVLLQALQWIAKNHQIENVEMWLQSELQAFNQVKLGRVSSEIQNVYLQCLTLLEANTKTPDSERLLATLISMAPQIINSANPPKEFDVIIRYCMLHSNDRIQANAIQVWGSLDLQMSQIKEHMRVFRHNRSLANFLVASLKKNLDRGHLKLLTKMLENKNEFMRAAGAYAFGEISAHYKKYNPEILEANPVLLAQTEVIKKLIQDPHPMVRRQAERALGKV